MYATLHILISHECTFPMEEEHLPFADTLLPLTGRFCTPYGSATCPLIIMECVQVIRRVRCCVCVHVCVSATHDLVKVTPMLTTMLMRKDCCKEPFNPFSVMPISNKKWMFIMQTWTHSIQVFAHVCTAHHFSAASLLPGCRDVMCEAGTHWWG